jgi:hypothetical protein
MSDNPLYHTAKDAMIEYEQRVNLLQEIIERQAALIREYEAYIKLLKEMLQRKDAHAEL